MKEPTKTELDSKILVTLLSSIYSNHELTLPLYCDFIKSEKDADNLKDILPLIYIWNEDELNHTFSVSINGSIVGSLLETIMPRSNPKFNTIRDDAMTILKESIIPSIISTCEKFGATPSVVFGLPDNKDQ